VTPDELAPDAPAAPYDGMKVYAYGRADLAQYEVRGRCLFRRQAGAEPEFEIIGNRIYPYFSLHGPVLEIRDGRYVHRLGSPRRVYEFRP
jgi:hypothetical protein